MKYCKLGFILLLFAVAKNLQAQNSVLVNFGGVACNNFTPTFSLIKNPLSSSPEQIANCSFSSQLPSVLSTFIAYNPRDNKIYIANNRTNVDTKIWVLDVGLPASLDCPASIPVSPSYSYTYVSNNFEFDNDGDLWSFSNYNWGAGRCNIDKFDVNTGAVISTKVLQFPAGNFPTTINSGDLAILPNGRMFACLGDTTCRLYEIINYNNTAASATAVFLQVLPQDCYGLSYLDGKLEAAGTLFDGICYYYDYNIATGVLGPEKTFQTGLGPIDNTSITPAVGCTKKLLSAVKINANTADLVYEIYVENLGNVVLNNINVTENLTSAFGTGNISNVQKSFVPGSNAANLSLNLAYNGTTQTLLLNPGQNLKNKVLDNQDYFFKIQVSFRATNLNTVTTYLNSAIARANIGSSSALTIVPVSDSSNNGDTTVVDPNKNGNASDVGENVPTPFNFGTLPVLFINASATLLNQKTASVNWQVAVPMENAARFEIEFSNDGRNWGKGGELVIDNFNKANWQFTHNNTPTGNLYYRIKQVDKDGSFTYSRILLLKNKGNNGYVVYPNPANNFIAISTGSNTPGNTTFQLFDATGRLLANRRMLNANEEISTASLPGGTYLLKLINADETETFKVMVQH